jgi:hypothetical protein
MMKFKNFCETLGVSRSATQEEVKHPYRKPARKYQPDVRKGPVAEARFKTLAESLHRARLAGQLSRHVEIDPPRAAPAHDLLDEISALRARLQRAEAG